MVQSSIFEGFPRFDNGDAFVDIFREMGCPPGIFDIHHGGNGVIGFESSDLPTGQWSLFFHSINLGAWLLTQLGVEYGDVYVRQNGRWWIAETRSRRKSFLLQTVVEGEMSVVAAMGEATGLYGGPLQ